MASARPLRDRLLLVGVPGIARGPERLGRRSGAGQPDQRCGSCKLTVLSGLVGAGVMMAGERLSVRALPVAAAALDGACRNFCRAQPLSISMGRWIWRRRSFCCSCWRRLSAARRLICGYGKSAWRLSPSAARCGAARGRRNGGSPARLSNPGRLPHCRAERHVLADAALQPGRSGMGGGRPENCRRAHLPRRRAD